MIKEERWVELPWWGTLAVLMAIFAAGYGTCIFHQWLDRVQEARSK